MKVLKAIDNLMKLVDENQEYLTFKYKCCIRLSVIHFQSHNYILHNITLTY